MRDTVLTRFKNVATIITFTIRDADGDLVSSAADLDSEIDGYDDSNIPDGFADCTNEATEIGSTGIYYLSLTANEMDNDYIIIQVKTSSAGAKPPIININTRMPDFVWDEALTGNTHNVSTSAGKRLRELAGTVIISGTAVSSGVGNNQIELNGDASSSDGAYDPSAISIIAGTGAGQTRLIYEYKGSTKIATVDRNWKINPENDSEYIITAHPGREHVNEGLARAGDTNTITLNVLASVDNNAYNGQIISLRSGTGEDQVRIIESYDGTSKIATVDRDWDTTPDSTTGYVMLPFQVHTLTNLADAIWDDMLADHQDADSFGRAIRRILGMLYFNMVIEYGYSGDDNNSAYLYLYDTKANATTHDKSTGLIGTYSMAGTFNASNQPTVIKFYEET